MRSTSIIVSTLSLLCIVGGCYPEPECSIADSHCEGNTLVTCEIDPDAPAIGRLRGEEDCGENTEVGNTVCEDDGDGTASCTLPQT